MVGHPSAEPAGVGSTPTKSSRHLLGVCKVQRAAKKETTHDLTRSGFMRRLEARFPERK